MKRKIGTRNEERGSKNERLKYFLTSSFIVLTSSFLPGCAPYAQVQTDLLDQSRRGIAMAQQHAAAKQSADAAQQNLDAIDGAIQRVRWLVTVPLSWFQGSAEPATPQSP